MKYVNRTKIKVHVHPLAKRAAFSPQNLAWVQTNLRILKFLRHSMSWINIIIMHNNCMIKKIRIQSDYAPIDKHTE